MPNLGPPELILILVIVIIVFGVGRLGEVGSALGKGIREFRKTSQGLDEEPKEEPKKDESKKAEGNTK